MNRIQYRSIIFFLLAALCTASSCKKFLDIPLPVNQITGEAAFANDNAATAAVNNIFAQMSATNVFSGSDGVPLRTGLYGDELIYIPNNFNTYLPYYTNALDNTNGGNSWKGLYAMMYAVNRAIGGIESSTGVAARKNRLLGESYFSRALLFFYLTNLYGTVPLTLTDNYTVNNELARAPQADVYKQIIADAKKARELLDSAYVATSNFAVTADRARPNKFAAAALLARAYLYSGDWKNAELEASTVINNAAVYQMPSTNGSFLLASKEIIWGIAPQITNNIIKEVPLFYIRPDATAQVTGTAATLDPALVSTFEAGDARRTNWVASVTIGTNTEYYANKYKARVTSITPTEYVVMFRLAEMYLIRAEARAKQGLFNGANSAISDVDAVRARADLTGSPATGEAAVLAAIAKERRLEFFTEQGHRLFDLRRTGKLDEVMNAIAASKGAQWDTKKQWWPLQSTDIFANRHLIQTDGYQ